MTRLTIAACLALLAVAPSWAQQDNSAEVSDPEAARIIADCSARKFESSIEIDNNGEKRLTSFKLCAVKDSDDAAWVRTLKDAKSKILAHPDISAESKTSIAAQLDVEIAKFGTAQPALAQPPVAEPAPPAVAEMAPPVVAEPAPPVAAEPAPQPAPAPVPVVAALPPPAAKSTAKALPRLTIRCLEPGEKGAGSRCSSLGRATRLEITADAAVSGGTSLRFLRRGDERAKLALAPMRQGDLFRTKLPPELCAGVASSKVEIQVMGGSQVVETLGPYNLRC